MPNISGKYVEETQRRQNRTGKFLLDVDVTLNNVGIRTESVFAQCVDVFAIKAFVEADLIESGLWMKRSNRMQRRTRRKSVRRQTKENSEREDDRQQDDINLAQAGLSFGHHLRRFGGQLFKLQRTEIEFPASGFSPKRDGAGGDDEPWKQRPPRPVLFRVIHRQRDRPGQTARGD